jgi:hypothetical protein
MTDVVCILDDWPRTWRRTRWLVRGAMYTVRSVDRDGYCACRMETLTFYNLHEFGPDAWWWADYFRPIDASIGETARELEKV